jgi:glycosyltransferase involved in cell wall biosynthesis
MKKIEFALVSSHSLPRLIFINRYFHPDQSATSRLLSDLAFALADAGHNILILTSRQRYDDPDARLPAREILGRVEVHRLAGTRFGRITLLGRAIDYVSFYVSMAVSLLKLARAGDTIVPMTDPPMLSLIVVAIARLKDCRIINWLQDLYPEVALAAGTPFLSPIVAKFIKVIRDRSLRAADCNVVIAAAMAERVSALDVKKEHIRVIHNWVNDPAVSPIPAHENPLRRAWGLEDKFVVGYSGNLGRVHDIDTILLASGELVDCQIVFLCIGGGAQYDALKETVEKCGLTQLFRFMPYQSETDLPYSLSAADVHWLSHKPEFEGLVFPSKFYGIAAVGRPIVAITSRQSELAKLVSQYQCGLVVEQGDGKTLALELKRLKAAPEVCSAMGERARAMLKARFSRAQAINAWTQILSCKGATAG